MSSNSFDNETPTDSETTQESTQETPCEISGVDSIVRTVLEKFIQRSRFGKQKYGTDLDRTDLSMLDWINHAQEEHMDAILYLEKIKQEFLNGKYVKTT
jgi:hypothetical protein